MEITLFIGMIGFASVFVMMSLGYSGRKSDSLIYDTVKICDELRKDTAVELLDKINREIYKNEWIGSSAGLLLKGGEYHKAKNPKKIQNILKKQEKFGFEHLEYLNRCKKELEIIIENKDKHISDKAGDAESVFNLNPVPA